MIESVPTDNAHLTIDYELITGQDSFNKIEGLKDEDMKFLLKASHKLANNPSFQDIVQGTFRKVERAKNPGEITETLEEMNRDIFHIQMVDQWGWGKLVRVGVGFPGGAIDPAIDAVWETVERETLDNSDLYQR